MKGKQKAVLFLLLLAVGASGCAPAAEVLAPERWKGPVQSDGRTSPSPALPHAGQTLTLNLGIPAATLDSIHATDRSSFMVLSNVMEGLVRSGPTYGLLPGVAAQWESADGFTYTFRLRPDARWHDGTPVTAHDFRFAWLRALDPRADSPYAHQFYLIDGAEAFHTLSPGVADFREQYDWLRDRVAIRASDDLTLSVRLRQPAPYWPALTALPVYLPQPRHLQPLLDSSYGTSVTQTLYNGPFRLEEWQPSGEMLLVSNDTYWDAAAVRLQRVILLTENRSADSLALFLKGSLGRVAVPGALASRVRSRRLSRTVENATVYLGFNFDRQLLSNIHLRRAFHLAIDRSSLTQGPLSGDAVAAEGLVPPHSPGTEPYSFRDLSGQQIRTTGNRLEAGRQWEQALRALGGQEVTLLLLHGDTSTSVRVSQAIQGMLQAALPGLTIQLDGAAPGELHRRAREGAFDLILHTWVADCDDPFCFLQILTTGDPFNDTGWSSKEFDRLLEQAYTRDQPLRMSMLADAEQLIMTELPVLPLYHRTINWLEDSRLHGLFYLPVTGAFDLKGAHWEGRP